MKHLLNQLVLIAGAWRESEDPVIEMQFSILFEELKQITKLDHAGAEQLLQIHISGEVAA